MWWIIELISPQSQNPVLHWRNPPGRSKLWCGPASEQMSRKHTRWDRRRRWRISSAQTEWQNAAQMIKSRGRAGEIGETQSLCFPSGALDSVEDGKHFYFTHQRITSCRLHHCHHCAIKHKSLRSSAKSPEWMSVWQTVVTNHRFCDREDWENANNVSHTLRIPEINFSFVFFFQPVCHHWLVCVFSNIIWRQVKLSRKNSKHTGHNTGLPILSLKVTSKGGWLSISCSLTFLPQQLNLSFGANEWRPCIIDH